jgi:hypothetical protein
LLLVATIILSIPPKKMLEALGCVTVCMCVK